MNLNEISEALDIINDGTLEQNTQPNNSRSKREVVEENLTNEERRVAGVSVNQSVYLNFFISVIL